MLEFPIPTEVFSGQFGLAVMTRSWSFLVRPARCGAVVYSARPLPAGERSALIGDRSMNLLSTIRPASDAFHPHADFLQLRPIIDRHARVVFRTCTEVDREEASAEAVAAAFE